MLVELTWVLVVAVVTSVVLAASLGANDVGNFFGTSVGANVLSIRKAFLLAAISEILGSVLLGEKVSDTIWKKIVNYSDLRNRERFVMVGNLSAMIGCCIWLVIATKFKLPVSATHSIIGATVGYAMVAHGTKGVNWIVFIKILISWLMSPLLAGTLSMLLLWIVRRFLSTANEPAIILIKWLPFIYGFTVMINVFSILVNGQNTQLHLWQQAVITTSLGILVSLLVWYFTVPRITNSIRQILVPYSIKLPKDDEEYDSKLSALLDTIVEEDSVHAKVSRYIDDQPLNNDEDISACKLKGENRRNCRSIGLQVYMVPDRHLSTAGNSQTEFSCVWGSVGETLEKSRRKSKMRSLDAQTKKPAFDRPDVAKIFGILQVMSAIFGSFTHGGNDVSNAIAPLVAIWMIWVTELNLMGAKTPLWILMHGGLCISIGIWFFGEGTTITIGKGITYVTPTSGFVIELCSAIAVLIASNLGLPVSSTHCKVGSVVCVGSLNGARAVNWKLVRNIAFAWTVTFPATAITSAGVMTLLIRTVPNLD